SFPRFGAITLSLHPAGHVLGSAQVRLAHDDGRVWVVTDDYKRDPDPTCAPFEVIPCDTCNTVEKFGPVRSLKPQQVLEIASKAFSHPRGTSPVSRCVFRALCAGGRTSRSRRPTPSTRSGSCCASMAADTGVDGLQAIEDWFARQGWQPAPFQRRSWAAFHAGQSGLIHASTGSGKTLAAWLGPVSLALEQGSAPAGLRVLWITPLRALASDTAGNLQQAVDGLGLEWRVETRTGDTSASVRARQRRKLPHALVTTPESLSVLLSYRNVEESFRHLDAVIVDEWHELLGSKRGVQLQLCLAWLRARRPGLPVWGLSATLGNLDEAMQVLLGEGAAPGVSIAGDTHK